LEIGVYSLVGIGIYVILLGVTVLVGKGINKVTNLKLKIANTRNKETTFLLMGMKSVKLNCWEEMMQKRIEELKRPKNRWIFFYNSMRLLLEGFYNIASTAAAFFTILIYNSLHSEKLKLDRVFFVLASFNILLIFLRLFYISYNSMKRAKVSLVRVENLLKLPDKSTQVFKGDLQIGEVSIKNCTSSYKKKNFHEFVKKLLKNPATEKKENLEGIITNIDIT
jgi:ABC-type multidrug transport system fused ATPase/permease subunit